MDCFAMNENGKCTILSGGICEGTSCGFHKTEKEQGESLKKASARLRSLPESQQEDIADRYYGGKREWQHYAEKAVKAL